VILVACLHSRKATVSTDSLSHVHTGDGGTNMTETIYTIAQELTSAAVFLTECYDPPSQSALIDRLDLLMASNVLEKTGVKNELISICDELLRQNMIAKDLYKK